MRFDRRTPGLHRGSQGGGGAFALLVFFGVRSEGHLFVHFNKTSILYFTESFRLESVED